MNICSGREPTPYICSTNVHWTFDRAQLFTLKGGVFLYIPIARIDSLGDAEVKRELGNDLPSEAQVSATAQTVGCHVYYQRSDGCGKCSDFRSWCSEDSPRRTGAHHPQRGDIRPEWQEG